MFILAYTATAPSAWSKQPELEAMESELSEAAATQLAESGDSELKKSRSQLKQEERRSRLGTPPPPSYLDRYDRILTRRLIKGGHVIMDLCTVEGVIERR